MRRGLVDELDQLVRELEHLDERRQQVVGCDLAVVDRRERGHDHLLHHGRVVVGPVP